MAFEALELSIQAVAAMRAPVEKLRTRNAGLYKQILQAGSSIAMNLSEGRRRIGQDRLHHFRIAASSAEESHTGLRVAVAWGQLELREVQPALELLDRVLRMLWRLTR
jgi:four helix bundle protein